MELLWERSGRRRRDLMERGRRTRFGIRFQRRLTAKVRIQLWVVFIVVETSVGYGRTARAEIHIDDGTFADGNVLQTRLMLMIIWALSGGVFIHSNAARCGT